MKKTDAELKANYEKFLAIVNKYFTGERLKKLLFMYSDDELGGNLMISPASGNKNYHNAYEGGYIDHIFNVCKNALKMKKTFEEAGGVCDFTEEELIFVALHHDLGKLGTKEELFTLSKYGIAINENEYFGIKLTDGLYDEDNEKYYKVYDTSKYLKSNIQYIMHWADHMSTVIERQSVKDDKFSFNIGKF